MVAIDPVTVRKLVLAKQIFLRAQTLAESSPSNQLSNLLAVIQFDLANETALKAVVGSLNSKDRNDRVFSGLVDQVENLLQKHGLSLPQKQQLLHVHDHRNDAQHKEKYPTPGEVQICRAYSHDFMSELCSTVWDIDWIGIRLLDLVQNNEAKDYFLQAEEKFGEEDYVWASALSMAGLEVASAGWLGAIVGSLNPNVHSFGIADRSVGIKPDRKSYNSFKKIRQLISYQTLGIPPTDYLRFLRYTRFVTYATYGNGKIDCARIGPAATKEECEFVLTFAVNSVITIESTDSVLRDL